MNIDPYGDILGQEIEEAMRVRLEARRDKEWSAGRAVLLDKHTTPLQAMAPEGDVPNNLTHICSSAFSGAASASSAHVYRREHEAIFFGPRASAA